MLKNSNCSEAFYTSFGTYNNVNNATMKDLYTFFKIATISRKNLVNALFVREVLITVLTASKHGKNEPTAAMLDMRH